MNFVIQPGNSGLAVYKIQQYLNALRLTYPSLPNVEMDCFYGTKMQTAIMTFQALTGLNANGIIDSLTWDKLIEKTLTLSSNVETISSNIQYGSSGLDVLKIQGYLNILLPDLIPLVKDGHYGAKTESRIIQFQIQQGLTATGKVDAETWNRMISLI